MIHTKWLLLVLVLGACARDQSRQQEVPAGEAQTGMPMQGMHGGVAVTSGMIRQMRQHMDSVHLMSSEQMHGELAVHRQMVDSMLSGMNREWQGMNVSANPAWNALVDSIRSDMTQMQNGMTAAQWTALRDAHYGRMLRLMDMHSSMMRGM